MSPKSETYVLKSNSKDLNGLIRHLCNNRSPTINFKMIPNLRMGYYHQREYLEQPCNIRVSDKVKKPLKDTMEGFEYSSLFASKTYSILSYIVGGFVGSKSQMNNNKHNLSYDLSTAIFNLLNPCKFEREKVFKKSNDNFYCSASKISPEGYDKYIVKSSHKGKMIDWELEWLENYMIGFEDQCYDSNPPRENSINCDEIDSVGDYQSTMESRKLENCLADSVDVTDRVSVCKDEAVKKEHSNLSINCGSNHFRQQSECSIESTDSESYIIFDGPDEDEESRGEDWKLENFDFGSYDDDEEEEDDNSSCDEYDVTSLDKELAEANEKWINNYQDVKTEDDERERKVRFNENVKINKIVAWDFAYRAARPGPWEQMARDRVRFRERILRLSPTISPILRKEHRDKIYKELYS